MKYRHGTLQKLLCVCLILALVVGVLVPVGASAADNLIADPSFDTALTALDGDGTALSKGSWTSVSWAFGITEEANAHTGTNLAHLVYATDGLGAGQFPCIYQDVDVQPNSIYRLTFWVKYWNVNAVGQPLYYGYRNALQDVWTPVEQYAVSDLTNEYRQITLEINTKELTTIRIFAFTTSTEGGYGGYHLDDFALEFVRTEHTEESGGLLTDGSFNNAMTVMADANAVSTGVWTSMSWASANQELANAYAGSGVAHLVCAADGLAAGEFPTVYQDVVVQPNSIYRLTFYAKHWNAGATVNPLYYGYRNALQDVWTPVEQYAVSDLTNEYRQITLEFNTKELTTIRVFAFTQSVSGGYGGYHLDNFKLEFVKTVNAEESGGLLTDGSFNNTMTVMTDANAVSTGVWTSMSWASANQEEENAYAGSGVAHLVCAADGLAAGEFPTIYQDVVVQPNSIYRLTFYAKHWNAGATVNPLYYGYRNALQDVWTPVEQYDVSDLTNEYRQITLEFDTKTLTTIRVFAFTQSVSGGLGGYHLDNFKLEYVGPNTPALKLSSASLTVENGISVNFKADAALFTTHGYQSPSATFTINDNTFSVTSYTEKEGMYVFTLYNIRPDWMGETITATLNATLNGESVQSTPMEYSVKQYCDNMLDDEDSTNALKTLLVDLLNYGAAAQVYTGHNVDALVNADLTAEEKQLASSDTAAESQLLISGTPAQEKATWNGVALYLRERTRIRVSIQTELEQGITVVITAAGQTYTVTQDAMTAVDGGYVFYFDGLTAMQMRTPVEMTVCENEVAVSQTLRYSVQTYVAKAISKNEDAALINMLQAMLRYGDSALSYAS